jgi:uncharacterized protein YegP (UPF0339 family)
VPAKFQIKKAKNGKVYFNLLATNGEVILTSQMYASKATVKKGIASVQANASDVGQFEEKTNKAGKHYFVLRAKNRQVIGNGEAYSSKAAATKGIKSVSKNAPTAGIEDVS